MALLVARADLGDEGVLEQLLNGPSFLDILLQAPGHKVAVVLRKLHFVQSVCVLGGNEIHGFQGRQSQVWWLTLSQLHGDHTHRPDIDQLIVELLLDQLGSHPGWSAHHGLAVLLFLGELDSEAEVSHFDSAIFVHQNVVALQVPMDLLQAVQSIQALQNLLHNEG